jgi:hypothetical protein
MFLFLAGASVAVDVPVMGRIMGPDLLCSVALLVALVTRRKQIITTELKVFLLMVGLWLFGSVITDLIRGTALEDLTRGWSKIIFFTIVFVWVYLATEGKLVRIMFFLVGLYVGELLTLAMHPDDFFLAEPWKFGYGPPINIFVLIFISNPHFRGFVGSLGQSATIVFLGVINLIGNSRLVFGVLLAVACILLSGQVVSWLFRGRRIPKWLFVLFMLGGVIFYQGVVSVYEFAASSGALGPDALEKYEWQTQGGTTGLLLGGRAESLVSTQAIADSPIIGHGSWARDYGYVSLYLEALEKRGVPLLGDYSNSGLIPSHSFLLGSWVEAGVLGGVFWIYVLALCGRSLYSLFHIPDWSRPLVAFVVLSLIWDVLFSPFGAQERFVVPIEMCIVLWAIRNERSDQWREIVGREAIA